MADKRQIDQLAHVLAIFRPDWNRASVATVLGRMTDRPYTDLAVAAVSCALDPRTVTPARIVEYGPWWVAAYQAGRQATPSVGPGAEPRCDVGGHEHELARACRCCAADRKADA